MFEFIKNYIHQPYIYITAYLYDQLKKNFDIFYIHNQNTLLVPKTKSLKCMSPQVTFKYSYLENLTPNNKSKCLGSEPRL